MATEWSARFERMRTRVPWYFVLLGAVTVLSVVVRAMAVQRDWLWYDEYYSAVFASAADAGRVLDVIETVDFHPPLYYLQLRVWAAISTTEGWLLLNSLLWGVLALGGSFLAGAKLGGKWGGLFSLALLGVLPLAVKEASELRMYTMLIALSAWATLSVLEQMTNEGPRSWMWGGAAALLACGLSWSHGSGFLWLAVWAALVAGLVVLRAETHEGLRSFIVSFGAASAASVPCILDALKRRPGHLMDSESAEWSEIIGQLLPGGQHHWAYVLVAVVLGVMALAVIDVKKVKPLAALLASVAALLSMLFVVAEEIPVAHLRTVIFVAPLCAIVIGAGGGIAVRSKRVWPRAIGALTMVVLIGVALHDGMPLLERPQRSAAHIRLARALEKNLPTWGPRLGTAYALCWELADNRKRIDPVGPLVCETADGMPIYTGGRLPSALRSTYSLVLRHRERIPSLPRNEKVGKFRKVHGHRVASVGAR